MDWIKKVFQREVKEEAKCLKISDLDSWLDQKAKSPEFDKSLKDIYNRIEELADALRKDIYTLKNASYDEESNPSRLINSSLASREAVLNQMESLVQKLAPPENLNARSASEYHSSIVKLLGNTVVKLGRAQRFVKALFPSQSERLNSDLNRLSRLLVELNELVNKRQKSLDDIDAAKGLLSTIRDKCIQISNLRSRIAEDEKRLSNLKDQELKYQSEIDQLASSAEGKRAQALKDGLDQGRSEIQNIESEAKGLVSPVGRALSRVIKQDSRFRYKGLLEHFSESPLDTLGLGQDISEPLRELRSKFSELKLKEDQREKVLEQLGILIDSIPNPLEALKKRRHGVQGKLIELEKELSKISSGSQSLEKEIAGFRMQMSSLTTSLEQAKRTLAALENQANDDEANLKGKIDKVAGRPLEIDIGG